MASSSPPDELTQQIPKASVQNFTWAFFSSLNLLGLCTSQAKIQEL